jgi:hypothetical protein
MSHILVTDIGTIVREEYTLIPEVRWRLTQLIVEGICSGHVPSRNSSIPVITHARAPPFSAKINSI